MLTSSVLASPGTPTSSDVAAGEERDQQLLDHLVLADDDLADLSPHSSVILGKLRTAAASSRLG